MLGLLLLLGLPTVRASLPKFLLDGPKLSAEAIVLLSFIAVAAVVIPFVVLIGGQRRGWLRASHMVALWVLVLGAGTFLVWDDSKVLHPVAFEDLSPTQPGDDATFAVYLRYAKNTPAANAVISPKLLVGAAGTEMVAQPEKWITYLREHRAEIETEWARLAPVRAWWDELAAAPRIGDLTAARADAPIVAFQPTRLHAQFAVAIASLQAIDGHGDEAMATVTRLYSVARKFEPNARTLVRAMIAKVIQKMALQTAGFVLDHATISPAARATFAAELAAAATGPTGARHLVLIESGFAQPLVEQFIRGEPVGGLQPLGFLQHLTRIFGGLLINPRATVNFFSERLHLIAGLAEARRISDLEDSKNPANRPALDGYHFKNIGGRMLADMAIPSLSKVVKTYWDIDDLRLAFLARLRT